MRAVVHQEVFEGEQVDPLRLNGLIDSADSRCHTLVLAPPWDQQDTGQPVNRWLAAQQAQLANRVRLLLREWSEDDAASPCDRFTIEVVAGDSSYEDAIRLGVAEAGELLQMPLRIVLENEFADWSFLLRVADSDRKESLRRAQEQRALEPRNAGGLGNMKTIIKGVEQRLNSPDGALRATAAKEAIRMWVLFDRDGAEEDRRLPSASSKAVEKVCGRVTVGRWSLAFHRLQRRSIENYLPMAALWTWAQQGGHPERRRRRETVECYTSQDFGAERRNSYDMKEGLLEFAGTGQQRGELRTRWRAASTPKARAAVAAEIQPGVPFDALSGAFRFRLLGGFGNDIAGAYADDEQRDEAFLQVFDDDQDAHAERDEMLGTLFRRL